MQIIEGLAKEFLTTSEILSEDTLAPYLFVIIINYIPRQSVDTKNKNDLEVKLNESFRDIDKFFTAHAYADDIAIMAALPKVAALEEASAKGGLFQNAKKRLSQ